MVLVSCVHYTNSIFFSRIFSLIGITTCWLCYTVGPSWLSVLYIAVFICQSQPPNLCYPDTFLCLLVYFCFVNKFIQTVTFLPPRPSDKYGQPATSHIQRYGAKSSIVANRYVFFHDFRVHWLLTLLGEKGRCCSQDPCIKKSWITQGGNGVKI